MQRRELALPLLSSIPRHLSLSVRNFPYFELRILVSFCEKQVQCLVILTCFVVWSIGRYNKYSRVLSQTPWLINNVRHCESSVEVKSDKL